MEDRTRRIEERAHSLWEMEGRPHGRDAQHWQQAEREIDAEDAARASATSADTTARGRKPRPKAAATKARKTAQASQGPEASPTADAAAEEPAKARGRKPKAAAGDEPEAPKAKRARPPKAEAGTPAAASASGRGRKPKAAAIEGGEAPKTTRGRKARTASEAGPVGAAADREPASQDLTAPDEDKDRSPEAGLDAQMSQAAAGTAGPSDG
ncbi:DUF2934 domain-containing protein [Paracoccus acridae]